MNELKLSGRRCQCAACKEYFNSIAGFDKHPVGPYDARKCLTPEEMLALGMSKNEAGFWITVAMPKERCLSGKAVAS